MFLKVINTIGPNGVFYFSYFLSNLENSKEWQDLFIDYCGNEFAHPTKKEYHTPSSSLGRGIINAGVKSIMAPVKVRTVLL